MALILLPCGLSAATYYVSTAGSDSNPGTSTSPLRTVQRGVDLAGPGDTVIVRDGTYGRNGCASDSDYAVSIGKAGTSSAYITIKSEHKWGAVLDSEQVCHSYVNFGSGAAYIVFQDFVVTRAYWSSLWANSSAHHIVIRGNRLENVGNWLDTTTPYGFTGIYTSASANNIVIDGNVLHDIGRRSGSTNHDHALYLHGSNFTITNNTFYNNTKGWSIQSADSFQNALIANNTFAFSNPNRDGQILLWGTGQANITIRNNVFYQTRNYAVVYCDASFSGTNNFDNNIVYGASGFSGGDQCSGASGTNTIAIGANRFTDPMLTNTSTAPYDFHLRSGSPAINTGVTVSAVSTDFDGNPRPQGSAYDVGAFEFASTAPAPVPPVISGVTASGVDFDSATITWTTDKPADSAVEYGIGGYTNVSPVDSNLVTAHSVTLSNLTASTPYHFRVDSRDSSGNLASSGDYTFTTAAAATTPSTPPPSGSGLTYYVATNGSDSNSGSSTSPLLTIQRAVDLANAGDTVIVRDGTYGRNGCASDSDYAVWIGKAGTSSAYITIKAEHKWGAVLDSEQVCHSYIGLGTGSAYIVIQDFVVTRAYWSSLWANSNAHHIVIRGNRLENVGNWLDTTTPYGFTGLYTDVSSSNFTIDGNVLHDIGRRSGSTNHDHALYLHGSNFTITNNKFYNNTKGWSIQSSDTFQNVLIANNTFAFPNPTRDGHILLWGSGQANITIRNNVFYQPLNYAVVYCDASFSGTNSFDHNIVYGAGGFSGGDQCSGASGTSTISIGSNSFTDPMLANTSTAPYDFHLRSGSPAIDTAMNVAAVNDDFDGNPRPQGSADDVGAYEYVVSTTPPAPAFAFSLSASPASLSVIKGQSGSSSVAATLVSGGTQTVGFTASSLPAGVTASFATGSCAPTCSTSMTVSVSSTAQSGTYTFNVSATGGGATASTPVTLTITDPVVVTPPPSTNGLVAWWKLDEGNGATASDATGNGNTGTFVGTPGWATGTYGTAASLNGASYIAVKESPSIEQSNTVTVSFWLRTSNSANIAERVVAKSYSWDVKLNGSKRYPQFTSGSNYAALNYSLPLNTWQHVVFTFSNGIVKGYINGALMPMLSNTFTGSQVLPQYQAGLNIGADAAGSNFTKGLIDDVRVYNRVLSASEISTLYSQTLH